MLVDPASFKVKMSLLHSAVFVDSRLPERVFRADYGRVHFLDFDSFSSDAFWAILRQLMNESSDQFVTLAALDPDPEHYFHNHFGKFGVVDIPLTSSAKDYRDLLSSGPGPVSDTLITNCYVLAWFPPSLQWVVWAERAPEIMVLALSNSCAGTVEILLECPLTIEDALDISSPAWRDRGARAQFARKLVENYGSGQPWTDSAPDRALALANQLVAGHIGLIEASRALSVIQFEFDAPLSELFQPFIAIASETDDLPVGQVRREWNASALAIKDIQIARYENEKRPLALKA